MTQPQQSDTVTLEQAWHFLMTQLAYRNPSKVAFGNLARKQLRNIRAGKRGGF